MELGVLLFLQSLDNPFFDFVAHAVHHIIRDEVVVFSASGIYLFTESPDFGLSLSITLCLSELVNGILKLYSVRPRPLWVSSALRRKGSTWEKDSSFPSSHSQAIMTVLSVFLLEGQKAFPPFTLKVIVWVLAVLTFLTGFSRAYLALHYVSDVVGGWLLGFGVSFFIHKMNYVSNLARYPAIYSVGLSVFTTIYILLVLLLAIHEGRHGTRPQEVEKWLETAKRTSDTSKTMDSFNLHNIVLYQIHLGAYFGATLSSVLLPHILYTPIAVELRQHRPHVHYSRAPPLARLFIGIGGILFLDLLKPIAFPRKWRSSWPEWMQAAFSFVFYALISTWLVGSAAVCAWGWPVDAVVI